MEDIFGYIFISIFMEAIFWGVAYTTGRVLVPIISLGNWIAEPIQINPETGKKEKKQTGLRLIVKSGKAHLGAMGVCMVGFCFWGIVITILLIV